VTASARASTQFRSFYPQITQIEKQKLKTKTEIKICVHLRYLRIKQNKGIATGNIPLQLITNN